MLTNEIIEFVVVSCTFSNLISILFSALYTERKLNNEKK